MSRRARQRARARRDTWTLMALLAVAPLAVLLWPVKSLLYYIPLWYIQLAFGL